MSSDASGIVRAWEYGNSSHVHELIFACAGYALESVIGHIEGTLSPATEFSNIAEVYGLHMGDATVVIRDGECVTLDLSADLDFPPVGFVDAYVYEWGFESLTFKDEDSDFECDSEQSDSDEEPHPRESNYPFSKPTGQCGR